MAAASLNGAHRFRLIVARVRQIILHVHILMAVVSLLYKRLPSLRSIAASLVVRTSFDWRSDLVVAALAERIRHKTTKIECTIVLMGVCFRPHGKPEIGERRASAARPNNDDKGRSPASPPQAPFRCGAESALSDIKNLQQPH